MSGRTTQGSSSAQRQTKSTHNAPPQHKSSSTGTKSVAAQKSSASSSTAKTSTAPVDKTNVPAGKRLMTPISNMSSPSSYMDRILKKAAEAQAKALADEAARKAKVALKKKQDAELAKERQARFAANRTASILAAYVGHKTPAQRSSRDVTPLERGKANGQRKVERKAPQQRQPERREEAARKQSRDEKKSQTKAKVDRENEEAAKKQSKDERKSETKAKVDRENVEEHSPAPVKEEKATKSLSGSDAVPAPTKTKSQTPEESEPTATKQTAALEPVVETKSSIPSTGTAAAQDDHGLRLLQTELHDRFHRLSDSHRKEFEDLFMHYCKLESLKEEEYDINELPPNVLMVLLVWVRGRTSNNRSEDESDDGHEDEQSGSEQVTTSPVAPEESEKSESQPEKAQPLTSSDGVNKNGKRTLADEGEPWQDSEDHRRKRSRSVEPYRRPVENSVDQSTQKPVTVDSAAIEAGVIPTANGDMVVFGANADAAATYKHIAEQSKSDLAATMDKQVPEKQGQKRTAMDAQLSQSIPQSPAKRSKRSDEKDPLLQAMHATGELRAAGQANAVVGKSVSKTKQTTTTEKQTATMSKQASTKPVPSAPKNDAATKKPQQSAPRNRFVPTDREHTKKPVERDEQGALKPATKRVLADKTNTQRQITTKQAALKRAPVPQTKQQPKAAEKKHVPAKPISRSKRSRDDDDDVETTSKSAKKQRTSPPPTPAPQRPATNAREPVQPKSTRASRSKTTALQEAPAPIQPAIKRVAPQIDLGDDYDDDAYDSDDQPIKKAKTEATTKEEETERDEVSDKGTAPATNTNAAKGAADDTQDTPADDTTPEPQPKKRDHIARSKNPPKKNRKPKPKNPYIMD